MRNLLSILCFLLPFLVMAQTNNPKCFILKSDATGFERNYEASLNPITCEIATLLEQPNDFKIFDYGLYLHLTSITGAVEDVMTQIVEVSAKDSKFYMTVTKIPSYDKVIERFDVKLKLPRTGVFTCLNSTKIGLIQDRISQKINAYHLSHQSLNFGTAIEEGLKELKATIQAVKSGNCCPLTEKEIQEMLFAEGFVAVPIGNVSDNSTNFNSYDYAQITYNGENIAKRLNEITTGFPTATDYHTYVTDNDNICNDTFFQQTRREYSESLKDFDVWFHIFKASNGKNLLFCRFEQYFWADKGNMLPPVTARPENSSNRSADKFLIFDPFSQKFYLSTEIAPLPNTGQDYEEGIPDPPSHIVSTGENFTKIVELYEYEFTTNDLQKWNPSVNGSNLVAGQKLLLFVEEYQEQLRQGTFGISLPFNGYGGGSGGGGGASAKWGFLSFVFSTEDVVKQLTEKGFTKEQISSLSRRPSIVKDIPIPKDLKAGKYIVEEILDVAKAPIKQKWYELFKINLARGATLMKGVNVIALMFEPQSTGTGATPATPLELVKLEFHADGKELPKVYIDDPNIDDKALNGNLKYVTYTKTNLDFKHFNKNLKNGRVYIGRSRGTGSPCDIVKARDKKHGGLKDEGYTDAWLDSYVYATKSLEDRHYDPSYWYVRGRENKVIKDLGGELKKNSPIGNRTIYSI